MKTVFARLGILGCILPALALICLVSGLWLAPASGGEDAPAHDVPTARLRLHEARQTLFAAIGQAEISMWGNRSGENIKRILGELLPLHAAYCRELRRWAPCAFSEASLQEWEERQRSWIRTDSIRPDEFTAWLDYLREEAEEAAAQYDKCWRRACRHAAADISCCLSQSPHADKLPTEAAWLAGEPMEPGAAADKALFYRLRDAHAFAALANSSALWPQGEHELATQAMSGELSALEELLRPLGETWGQTLLSCCLSAADPGEERFRERLWLRAGLSPTEVCRPVGNSQTDHLNHRVEAEAERMRLALDAAEAQLPRLPEKPDAACRRLLVQLAARWNAYTYALQHWGWMDSHRSFWWYGGCLGYRPLRIWGEPYYLAGIRLSRLEHDKLIQVDQSHARRLLTALIGEMREQLQASLEEHRNPRTESVSVYPGPWLLAPDLQPLELESPPAGEPEPWSLKLTPGAAGGDSP